MDLKSDNDFLFIDYKEKVVYSIPETEILSIERQLDVMYRSASRVFIPHLPNGINRLTYNSPYIGEIDLMDYKSGERYKIVIDTPAARILYGNPINKYIAGNY